MRRVRAANGGGRGFRKSEVTDLAFFHQARHGADGLFDGHGAVNAVLVVEIDGFDLQAPQARVAGLANVFRAAIDADKAALGVAHVAEFRGQHGPVPPPLQGKAHQNLVRAPP